ncbi:MAG: phenylacetate-CoA oxygenase/reductase subunit PaaK [Chitinophagaceae bacterium]
MSIHFHTLKIKDVKKETDDCVSISFFIPEDLKNLYSFSHGQNITLKRTINGEDVRRSYSICKAPFENDLRVAVKKAEFGLFSNFANENLKAGDTLEVLPPTGKFYTKLDPSHRKKYLAFAAGSGITPVISILKATLKEEPFSDFTLIYGNRSKGSIIFLEELEALKNEYLNRLTLLHILSREKIDSPINNGHINPGKLDELSKIIDYSMIDEIFICGPEEMVFSTQEFLVGKKIDKKKIHFELFTTPGKKNIVARSQQATVINKDLVSKITVRLDGRSFDFDLPYDGATILDAALKQGADLPFACKGGVCASCRSKLIEGEVDMEMNWALEPDEVEQGYILTCQSHPKTKKVTIDFNYR